MKHVLVYVALVVSSSTGGFGQGASPVKNGSDFDVAAATRFAKLALACVHKEYPNKIAHVLNSDADVAPPRRLAPAFYGCYDWHSSVHGHWLLARLVRTFPEAPFAPEAREALKRSLNAQNIAQEVAYLQGPGRTTFERPYGLAWLLQLGQELREWDRYLTDPTHRQNQPEGGAPVRGGHAEPKDPLPGELSANLQPLEQAAAGLLKIWLPKLSNPVRIGEHNQTAFAMGMMLDYARSDGDTAFADLLTAKARQFFASDRTCPLAYEPSGEDFLSPCLGEADLMRRVLPRTEFATWFRAFMPQTPTDGSDNWLKPVVSPDPSDPKLAHLDGLNLSRAWMLEGIASGLDPCDIRLPALRATATAHRQAGLAAVTGEHYEGGHWLGSFAVYLVTRRGISESLL
jgi:hypothetical protein